MAEEFQGGVCGGNWPWNTSRNLFRSSPCSSAINGPGSFGWLNHEPIIDHMKTAKSITDDLTGSPSDGSGSIVLQGHVQKPSDIHDQNLSIASTLPMMGITGDWNQDLLHDNGRLEQNYSHHMLQANDQGLINSSMNLYGQNSSINSYSYNSSLLQTLFDTDSDQLDQQSLLLDNNNQSMTNYSSPPNYMISNEICPSLTTKDSSMVKPTLPKQQQVNHLQFTNNTPFWNATSANFVPSTQPQLVLNPSSLSSAKPNLQGFTAKHHIEEARSLNSVASSKKVSNEPPIKRPRIETPSPLPTFKVRKEKLEDRITALQQLVSPFGKTDTASVLHEAIEYIKFLHDQVNVLSTPYLKNGSSHQLQHQQADNNEEGLTQDLKSRGLCLVPISSTFPVAAETTADFWTPTMHSSGKTPIERCYYKIGKTHCLFVPYKYSRKSKTK